MLELELATVFVWPDHDITLTGFQALNNERLIQYPSQFEKCLNSLDDRPPRSLWENEDIEFPLANVMTVDHGKIVLRESLNQGFLDMDKCVEI